MKYKLSIRAIFDTCIRSMAGAIDQRGKQIDPQYPKSKWKEMVDDYLDNNGGSHLKDKITVNLSTIENAL